MSPLYCKKKTKKHLSLKSGELKLTHSYIRSLKTSYLFSEVHPGRKENKTRYFLYSISSPFRMNKNYLSSEH